MRGHARMIYSVLSNGKQPPGNGIIVMRSNIIMKCHFSPPPPACLFKGSRTFPGSLSRRSWQSSRGDSEQKSSCSSSGDAHPSEPPRGKKQHKDLSTRSLRLATFCFQPNKQHLISPAWHLEGQSGAGSDRR